MRSRQSRNQIASRGAILVLVLVILGVIGIMTLQTTKLMYALSRSETSHGDSLQLRELIELGKLKLSSQLASDPTYQGETFEVEVVTESDFLATSASIEIAMLDTPQRGIDKEPAAWRISVRYPAGTEKETTATWESTK